MFFYSIQPCFKPKKLFDNGEIGRLIYIHSMQTNFGPIRIFNRGIGYEAKESIDFAQYISSIGDGDILIPKIPHGEPLKAECRAFIEACSNNVASVSDGTNGLAVVKAMASAEQSIQNSGARIEI